MNYRQTLDYLYAQLPMFTRIGEKAIKIDLANTLKLCKILNGPQHKFKSIHIAGTNGKGSVAHGIAAIFQAVGFKTGLYTSPHLKDFRERIKINGEPCPEDFVIQFTEKMKPHIVAIEPSFFELTVAMAFEYFAMEKVDIAIVETGLGGRLDSTNVILPQLSVITNISFDHQNILGNTLEEIAFEKAGIIKPSVPVVIGRKQETTNTIFVNKSLQKKSTLFFAEDIIQVDKFSVEKDRLEIIYRQDETERKLYSDLRSIYQVENIRTILAAMSVYQQFYPGSIDQQAIENGLNNVVSTTHFRGRWEIIREKPRVIVDVGHNEDGIRKAILQLRYESYNKLHMVYGAVKDKEIKKILGLLPREALYYFTEPPLPRKLDVGELHRLATDAGLHGEKIEHPRAALERAIQAAAPDDLIIVMGSFFIVSEVI